MSNKIYRCLPSIDKVGIEFNKDIINVYFPLGYDIPHLIDEKAQLIEEKKAILDVIKTVSLCKNNGEVYRYNYNYGKNKEIPINSYLWLLNDYIKNGLYNVRKKQFISSQYGKINWKRTFNTKPLFSDDEIVYLNPKVEIITKTDNIITEIHAICVNICINKIGWLFGNIERCEGFNRTLTDNVYIDILRRELTKTFDDKKKTLLNHLIRILLVKSEEDELDIKNDMLVDNYHYAWEYMIREVFGNDNDNMNKYFPSIKWNLKYKKGPKPKMRPDSVINKEDTLYILDAKYYKYGVYENGGLPGAEDVDKQITYGEFNNQYYKNVYNAFIMPYNKNDNEFNSNSNILDIGNVISDARILNEGEKYKKVAIILMDTKYLINCFFKKEQKDEEKLINSILESLDYEK